MNRPRFTKAEIELLKEIYPAGTKQEIMKRLKTKSWGTIMTIASRHGIRRIAGVHKSFSEAEIKIVRCGFPTWRWEKLLQQLPNRTKGSIRHVAMKHKVGKRLVRDLSHIRFSEWKGSFIKKLSQFERGYLAGLLDGEGNISFNKDYHHGSSTYFPSVTICNTDKRIIDWVHSRLGGYRGISKRPPPRKDMWRWQLHGNRKIVVFLREIAPLLVSKQTQATLLSQNYQRMTPDKRFAMWLKFKTLNSSKGRRKDSPNNHLIPIGE